MQGHVHGYAHAFAQGTQLHHLLRRSSWASRISWDTADALPRCSCDTCVLHIKFIFKKAQRQRVWALSSSWDAADVLPCPHVTMLVAYQPCLKGVLIGADLGSRAPHMAPPVHCYMASEH